MRLLVDQTRPVCIRCSQSKHTCQGYREQFIDERVRALQRKRRTVTQSSGTPGSDAFSENGQELVLKFVDSQRISQFSYQSCIPPSISMLPLKNDTVIFYLNEHTSGPSQAFCNKLIALTSEATSLDEWKPTKDCFSALATTFFGVAHSQKSIVDEGRLLYGRALKTVNASIASSELSSDHEVTAIIASVIALCLHEVSLQVLLAV